VDSLFRRLPFAGPRDSSNSQVEESESRMHKPIKYVEKAVTVAATGVWAVFERLNRVAPNSAPIPKWSD